VPLDGSQPFTLEALHGAGNAALSPDGKLLAYRWESAIWLLPVSPETGRATGSSRKLLEENGDWYTGKISWSDDSERILFVKWNSRLERKAESITLRDSRLNKQPDYADFGLVSPDGKMIAYSLPADGIWARPVGGGVPRIVRASWQWFEDAQAWTADSQWVASATRGRLRDAIHFVRLVEGRGFDLSLPEAVGACVGKSPDGKRLCFYRSSFDLRATVKVVPVSDGPAIDVGSSAGFYSIMDCSWSSDSASLAVIETDEEGHQHLWFIPLRGGDRVRFNMDSLGQDRESMWLWSLSADGRKLLFAGSVGTEQERGWYVVPISAKEGRTTGPATLAFKGWRRPGVVQGIMGGWSPDGTRIAMPHKSEKGNEYWILSADGSKPMRIGETYEERTSSSVYSLSGHPQWSPDGKMIAFYQSTSDREILQVIPAEGGTARTLLTAPDGQPAPFGWSPDSTEVLAACDGTITGIPIAGGSARVIVRLQEAGFESASWLAWSPDGQHLAFCAGKRSEASRLCLFSPSTGKTTTLDSSPDEASDFKWSPDSKMICCTAKEAVKTRPAGVIRELDVAAAVQKAPPVAEKKPAAPEPAVQAEPITGPVFSDNFDNGASKHWRFRDMPDEGWGVGRHAVENGALMLSHARASLDGIDWADYIVTVRVCVKEVAPSALVNFVSFGIAARAIPSKFGSSRMDRYDLGIFWDRGTSYKMWLGMNYADGSDVLQHGTLSNSPCSIVRDKWYTLEFEVRGQQLRGYLDGKLMVEATDARLSKGRLWIGTGNARVLFDDFSVRQLP
jgi:Tol biopolymer transport system component